MGVSKANTIATLDGLHTTPDLANNAYSFVPQHLTALEIMLVGTAKPGMRGLDENFVILENSSDFSLGDLALWPSPKDSVRDLHFETCNKFLILVSLGLSHYWQMAVYLCSSILCPCSVLVGRFSGTMNVVHGLPASKLAYRGYDLYQSGELSRWIGRQCRLEEE